MSVRLSITTQANQLGNWLTEWAAPLGGKVEVMMNLRHLWENIFNVTTSTAPQILICYNGEEARGGFAERNSLDRVDRQWVVVILRGHGFEKSANQQEPNQPLPFYDALEQLREKIRCLLSMSEEFPIDFKSIRPLPGVAQTNAANVFLDGYVCEFSTANDIPRINKLAPGQDPEATGEP